MEQDSVEAKSQNWLDVIRSKISQQRWRLLIASIVILLIATLGVVFYQDRIMLFRADQKFNHHLYMDAFDLYSGMIQKYPESGLLQRAEEGAAHSLLSIGQQMIEDGELDEGVKYILRSAQDYSNTQSAKISQDVLIEVYQDRCDSLIENQAFSACDIHWKKLINIFPGNQDMVDAYVDLVIDHCHILADQQKYQLALDRLDNLMLDYPGHKEFNKMLNSRVEYTLSFADQYAAAEDFEAQYSLLQEAYNKFANSGTKEIFKEQMITSLFSWAKNLAQNGEYYEAANKVIEVYSNFPDSEGAIQSTNWSVDTLIKCSDELVLQGEYWEAELVLEKALTFLPQDSKLNSAYYDFSLRVGELLYTQKQYSAAIVQYQKFANRWPEDEKAKDILVLLPQMYMDWGQDCQDGLPEKYQEGITVYETLIEGYPDHSVVKNAKESLYQLHYKMGEYELSQLASASGKVSQSGINSALQAFNEAVAVYPNGYQASRWIKMLDVDHQGYDIYFIKSGDEREFRFNEILDQEIQIGLLDEIKYNISDSSELPVTIGEVIGNFVKKGLTGAKHYDRFTYELTVSAPNNISPGMYQVNIEVKIYKKPSLLPFSYEKPENLLHTDMIVFYVLVL